MTKSLTRRAHVILPKRGRSAFLTELAQREIKLRRQREVLRETAGAWKAETHPELAQGAAALVRQIRALDTRRFQDLERRRKGKRPACSIRAS